MNTLRVSETFLSIQGEGASMGRPAIFLRLQGCNLNCHGFSGGCDTLSVWKQGKEMTFEEIYDYWNESGWITAYSPVRRIIITGGEPLLQGNSVVDFIQFLNDKGDWKFEIETNGTVWNDLLELYDVQINISPKLISSGVPLEKRYDVDVLKEFAYLKHCAQNPQWKFVIQEQTDVVEVQEKFEKDLGISRSNIWFMPEGIGSPSLNRVAEWLAPLCAKYGYNYSDRIQIRIWGNKQGV
jgi:organic radical activating enzyme